MVFRRDDREDDEVEEKISQFRRQLDTLSENEPDTWDDAEEMDWPDDQSLGEPAAPTEAEVQSSDPATQHASIVAENASWTGTLSSEGPITIYGTVSGDVIAEGNVHVARGAVVNARIQAANLEVAGEIEGIISCSSRFEVLETGQVRGEITAPVLVVHDGAAVEGRFRMSSDEDIDDEQDEESDI
ncbi:MAG: bactofilin family protein [Chloroflexota bacterium]